MVFLKGVLKVRHGEIKQVLEYIMKMILLEDLLNLEEIIHLLEKYP
jgi:hypothetical protein